ncbi:MAG TPA: hypothetical protein VI636_19140 [Candidatus Angelobacter sp.]
MKHLSLRFFLVLLFVAAGLPAWTQTCQTRDEIPDQAKTAMESAAQHIFEQAGRGDVDNLRSNSISALQSNFTDITGAVNDNKPALQGASNQIRTSFMLDTGATPSPDGHFYCGVFGATGMNSGSAEFYIPGLSAGKYGIVIQDLTGPKGPYALTTVFQDLNGWKMAGFQIRPQSARGHDGIWYLEQAREYKNKGQNHNAWFYYVTSWDLMAPVKFMNTRLLSKIVEESGGVQPKDLPSGGNGVSYSANGKTYNITDISVLRTDSSFDLSIKYSVPSTADFAATAADARNLANAYVTQYPELKDAFNNIWAHAIDSSGQEVPGVVPLKK